MPSNFRIKTGLTYQDLDARYNNYIWYYKYKIKDWVDTNTKWIDVTNIISAYANANQVPESAVAVIPIITLNNLYSSQVEADITLKANYVSAGSIKKVEINLLHLYRHQYGSWYTSYYGGPTLTADLQLLVSTIDHYTVDTSLKTLSG